MKKQITVILSFILLFSLYSCNKKEDPYFSSQTETIEETTTSEEFTGDPSHVHSFSEPTCVDPGKCHCGMENGKAPGHNFSPATCTEPKVCKVCGFVSGKPEHQGGKSTCTQKAQCEKCGVIYGDFAPHKYKKADDIVCKNCNKVTRLSYQVIDDSVTIIKCEEKDSKEMAIPSTIEGFPVTAIGDSAFEDCNLLRTLSMPESVTSIGNRAFYGCTVLKNLTLSENLTFMGEKAFSYCSSLTKFNIPKGITTIESETFWSCTKLRNVTFPPSVTTIGPSAFRHCSGLEKVILTKVKVIGNEAFANCTGLKSVTVSKELETVGFWSFSGCLYLRDVMYEGSKSQREEIEILLLNDFFESAIWHYNVVIKTK